MDKRLRSALCAGLFLAVLIVAALFLGTGRSKAECSAVTGFRIHVGKNSFADKVQTVASEKFGQGGALDGAQDGNGAQNGESNSGDAGIAGGSGENAGNGSDGDSGSSASQGGSSESSGSTGGSSGSGSGAGSVGGGNATPQAGHPSVCGALQVKGTQLCDSKGNPIQLRGISTHGLAWFPGYVNEDFFGQLSREWKVNVVRLALYTAEWGGYCTGGDTAYLKQLVKDGVSYATNQDMYVIIDWHVLQDQNPNNHKSEAKAFFQEMSKTYKSYNNVIYEICNEPNGGTGWNDVKSYANEIIPVIRENDPDAVILVGTPNWCQFVDQAAASPLTGYRNIMYTLHFYADTHRESLRNTMTSAIDAGLPIFVSEYGICDASGGGGINESQADAWIDTLNRYGVSYVAWNMSNKDETSAIFKSSCNKTSGFTQEDLSSSGKWLYKMLTNGSGGMAAAGSAGGGGSGSGSGGGTSGGGSGSGSGTTGGSSGASGGSGGNSGGGITPHILNNADVEIQAQVSNSWESGGQYFYQYSLTIKNKSGSDGTGWEIDVKFNENISLSSGWNGNYTVNGSILHIASMDYNGSIGAGGSTGDIGFIVSGSSDLKIK